MERLTPGVQNTYPLDRRIMEINENGVIGVEVPKSRMRRMLERHNAAKKEQRKDHGAQKKSGEKEPVGSAGTKAGGFAGFNVDKFKENPHLEELAKEVRLAGRQGRVDEKFLEEIEQKVQRRIRFGLISENWAQQFLSDVNTVVVSENLNESKSDERELSKDVSAIVQLRKEQGFTAEEVEVARAALGKAFGEDLTEAEIRRVVKGEALSSNTERAKKFEGVVSLMEKIAGDPRKFDSFISTIDRLDAESGRQILSGKPGEVVFDILLENVGDREAYIQKLKQITKGDINDFKSQINTLVREAQKEERVRNTPVDPERQKRALEQAEQWIAEQRKKREVTAEEVAHILGKAELGSSGVIEGGSDYNDNVNELIDRIDEIPDEPSEVFNRTRPNLIDEDLIAVIAEELHGGDPTRVQAERQRFLALKDVDDPREFKQKYKQFLLDLQNRANRAQSDPDRIREAAQNQQLGGKLAETGRVRKGTKDFNIKGLEDIVDEEFWRREPRNIQEVAAWIMAGDDRSIWGPDGVYPIFTTTNIEDPETGKKKREFHSENLIRWLRNKSLEHHGDNPNDPINLLQGVAIETLYKSVSILTMKYNKQKYFADENGKPLSNLADEVINEAWLFGTRRNKNLGYIQVMNSDEKLFDAIVEMSGKNDHTSGSTLKSLLEMGEGFDEVDGNKDNRVGDALLAANQIYRNLSDIENLRKIIPENSPIFTIEGFRNASRIINGEDFDANTTGSSNLIVEGDNVYFRDARTGIRTDIFKEGKLTSDKNLLKFLNFFPEANPQETQEIFVRELVKLSIAEMVGLKSGTDKQEYEEFKRKHGEISIRDYRKIERMNLEWAETNSWVEQRWNGAAARNDTGYRGYDAWTKMYMQYYRERQSRPGTAGPIGNPHDMQIFRMLTPDMWLGIRTETGESVQEIFDGLHMTNLELYKFNGDSLSPEQERTKKSLEDRKKLLYQKLRFPRWTESDWASNGVNRQAQVWHNVMNTEDLKFNELVKLDSWGIMRYDRQKFEEVVKDDFIKKRRYAFSSNNAINYGAITRMNITTGVDEKGEPIRKFKDMYLAEAMFGDVVIGSIRKDWFEGKLAYKTADENGKEKELWGPKKGEDYDPEKHGTFQGYLNSSGAREKILKNVCRAGLAAQIKAHRDRSGTTEVWNAEIIDKIYDSLESMPQYLEGNDGQEMRLDGKQFFSKKDIEWIRKHSGTTKARLRLEKWGGFGWDAAAEGLPDMFETFFDDIKKDLTA